MYCERCNIDFPEGLRYCKWCGQTLVERRRETGELYSCPACSATVQLSWAFCKACGEALTRGRSPGKSAGDSGDFSTLVMPRCPSCGDLLDGQSLYCKACGAAVYSPPAQGGS